MSERPWQERRTVPIRGELVRDLRLQRGWTAEQLASRAGVTKRLIEYIEQKKDKQVYPSTLEAIAAKFSIDPARLLAEQLKRPTLPPPAEECSGPPRPGGLAISVHMPSDDVTDPHLVAMFCGIAQKAMTEYESQKQNFMHSPEVQFRQADELTHTWEQRGFACEAVTAYFIPVEGNHGARIWCYGLLPTCLHDALMRSLEEEAQLIEEFIIVARGMDEPSPSVKATMRHYYGFDHDRLANRNSG